MIKLVTSMVENKCILVNNVKLEWLRPINKYCILISSYHNIKIFYLIDFCYSQIAKKLINYMFVMVKNKTKQKNLTWI